MGTYRTTRRVAIFAAGAAAGIAGYFAFNNSSEKSVQRILPIKQVFNSWTTNYTPSVGSKWDDNWDHRDPKSLCRPLRKNAEPHEENAHNEKLANLKPKAVRHLLLIRHGQYSLSGKTDFQQKLTELGRQQANFTGERLKALTLPWTVMLQSTMTRAQETAGIINKCLNVKVESCPLLEEGAPIPPEPPVGHWRPEDSVRWHFNHIQK